MPRVKDEGLPRLAGQCAGSASVIGLIGIGARVLVGGIFDKWSTRGVAAMYLVLGASALLALAALNPAVFAAFVVFRAVAHAAVLLDTRVLGKHVFGVKNLGLLLGVFTAVVNLGFALGPWAMSRLFQTTGSYVVPFILCFGVALFAAAVLLPLRPAYWLEMKARAAQRGATPPASSAAAPPRSSG